MAPGRVTVSLRNRAAGSFSLPRANRPLWTGRVVLGLLLLAGLARAIAAPELAGNWQLIPGRSTDLGGWLRFDLSIARSGSVVTISRRVASEGRDATSVLTIDCNLSDNPVPVPWWIDNRYIGAYSGGDKLAHMKGRWLDYGRVFRTEADLTLATQQGDHAVNILTDYRLSGDGNFLTVLELRSTRDLPLVYVFRRVP